MCGFTHREPIPATAGKRFSQRDDCGREINCAAKLVFRSKLLLHNDLRSLIQVARSVSATFPNFSWDEWRLDFALVIEGDCFASPAVFSRALRERR
jgi:hypothetical protein